VTEHHAGHRPVVAGTAMLARCSGSPIVGEDRHATRRSLTAIRPHLPRAHRRPARRRTQAMDIGSLIAIIPLGFVAGALARVLTPNDAFNKMSGPKSWALSLGLGVAGALVGYWFFTTLLGIGDADKFDWGGIIGAVIGAIVVTLVASFVVRRARP